MTVTIVTEDDSHLTDMIHVIVSLEAVPEHVVPAGVPGLPDGDHQDPGAVLY